MPEITLANLSRRLGELLTGARVAKPVTTASTKIRMLPWMALAMVEDAPPEQFMFQEEERLTVERLRLMAANHDPQVYRPPVYTGADRDNTNVGTSHWWGRFFDPLGYIEEVEFDGLTLWGRLSELVVDGVARISDAVARGRMVRSVGFHYCNPTAPGGFKLTHLALSGGEEPGQLGLPPLVQHLPGIVVAEDAGRLAIEQLSNRLGKGARELADIPVAVRFFNPQQQTEEAAMPMTPEEIAALSQSLRTAMTTDINAVVAPLQASVTALQAEVTGMRTTVTAVETAATEAVRTATVAVNASASQQMTNDVQQLVDSFRLSPYLVPGTLEVLGRLDEGGRTAYLAALRAAPPVIPAAARTSVVIVAGDGSQSNALLSLPDEVQREFSADGNFEPAGVRLAAQAIQAAGGLEAVRKNPRAMLSEALRLNGGQFPWGASH